MSWSHSITVSIEKDLEAIKAYIERLFEHSTIAAVQPGAAQEQVAAASAAAKALAGAISVPADNELAISVSGHKGAASVTVCAVPRPIGVGG